MSDTQQEITRGNRDGDPCPSWCATNHDEHLIPGKPEFGYMEVHGSARVVTGNVAVRAAAVPGAGRELTVSHWTGLHAVCADAGQAERLAKLVDLLAGMSPDDIRQVARSVREAAAMIGGAP
jgi:hypothetical protein